MRAKAGIQQAWREFLVALQFLSRIPVRLESAPTHQEIGRSILSYPLVGLLFGVLLAVPALLISEVQGSWDAVPAGALAALLVALWVGITGALHIDGLADSADGWLGGFGDPKRTLKIMTDSRSGAAAIAAVVTVLLMKFAALQSLLTEGLCLAILLAPVLGRTLVLVLVMTTPYLPTSQLGADLADHCPRKQAAAVLLCVGVLFIGSAIATNWEFVAGLLAALLTLLAIRRLALQRLGGVTGDITGATIECGETAFLLGIALLA